MKNNLFLLNVKIIKLPCIILLYCFLFLSGCIGENYDFSPPTASLVNPENISQEVILAEANIDWYYDEKYNKETTDILSLAKEQPIMELSSGQEVQYNFEGGIFDAKKVKIFLWQNETKIDLEVDIYGQLFKLPKEKGDYIIVLELPGYHGNAEYVGNISIK